MFRYGLWCSDTGFGESLYLLINVYVFIFLTSESIAPLRLGGGGARRESRRKSERADLSRLWAQSRCNKIQVCKRWSAGEPESPARGEASPLHEVLAERVKQEDWFNGGQPQQDDADDRPMTETGNQGQWLYVAQHSLHWKGIE